MNRFFSFSHSNEDWFHVSELSFDPLLWFKENVKFTQKLTKHFYSRSNTLLFFSLLLYLYKDLHTVTLAMRRLR